MASINLSGVLRDSLGEFSHLNKIRFTHNSTTGTTLAGFQQTITIPEDGSYDIDIEYGNVFIESKDATANNWFIHGTVTINSDTVASDLPTLLNAVTPVTDEQLLQLQTLLEEASTARDEAEASATAAAESATETETAVTAFYNSNPANIDWDLFVPFNSDDELDAGVGARNSYGNKAVTFSRSTIATVVNKTGILEDLAVDAIGIGKEGAWFHEAYTNTVLYSEDFTQSIWSKTLSSVSTGAQPFGSDTATLVTGTDPAGRVVQIMDVTEGDVLNFSAFINSENTNGTYVRIQSVQDNTGATSEIVYSDRLTRVSTTWEVPTGTTSVFLIARQTGTENALFEMTGVQTVIAPNLLPYVKTESTAVSVGSTGCTIPVNGNFPATGEPFSIVVDASVPDDSLSGLVSIQADSTFSLRRAADASIRFFYNDSFISAFDVDTEQHRISVTFDGDNISLYVDGELESSASTGGDVAETDVDDFIYIGSLLAATAQANGTIKNLGIINRALTADEVKARGGVK